MSKEEKNMVVPELRFPDFRESEEWEETTLKYAGRMQAGKFVSASEINETMNEGLFPCYGGNGLRGYTKSFTHSGKYSLIGRQGALCGNITLADSKFHATEHAVVVTPEKGIDTGWLFYLLTLLNLNQYATGQAQPGLSVDNLEKVEIVIPKSAEEQQKIADCLSSLDELITAESQQLDALKAHKKGLMQQLFPAEGETVPQLRFAEFRDSGEWEKKTLGSCLIRHPEYGINAAAVPYSENLPLYLRITDISEEGCFLGSQKVSVDYNVTSNNYLDEGDIVLARTGASVGKSYKYRIEDGKLVFAGFLIRVKPDKSKLISELLFQYLYTEQYWRWIAFTSMRSGQPGVNGNEFASMPIILPKSLAEQQKIADCLSSLDELIAAQAAKIEALKVHKKGLMQGLFPNLNS